MNFGTSAIGARISAGLAKISLLLRHHAWQASWPEALTPTQAQILAALSSGAAEGRRLSDVASLLAITPATASDAASALAAKGLINKRASSGDRRAIELRLTAKGKRVAARVSQWPDFLVSAIDALPAQRQEDLLTTLMLLVRSFQEQGRIPVARMCTNCSFFEPDRYAGSPNPHYCGFVQAPFGARDFRIDCPDFSAAPEASQRANLAILHTLEAPERR